jgi:hypothetical protein
MQPNADTQQDLAAGDKYIVRFQDGDEAHFYEIQLTKVPEGGANVA